MTVALVWPLNAAVLGPFASAMTAPTEQLLIGLPDGLAADFHSHQQLIEAHDVFRLMLYKQLQALQEKIANSDYQIIAIRLLLKTLHKRLHLPVDDKNFQHATQPVSQLDFGITEEDRDDLLKMSVYASWRRPGSEPFTTYASLLWRTLEQVDVASSVYASMPALLQPRIGVTSRNLYLTPEIGQTPHINVTPNINTTPTLSGTPRTSLTPLYHNSPIHSPDQRDFAGIEAACLACEEVIERGLAEWHRLNPPTAALSPAHPSWSRKKAVYACSL